MVTEDQGRSWGTGEKHSDSGCIFKVDWTWSVRERSQERTVLFSVEIEKVVGESGEKY